MKEEERKMKKKLVKVLALGLAMTMGLAACGNKDAGTDGSGTNGSGTNGGGYRNGW